MVVALVLAAPAAWAQPRRAHHGPRLLATAQSPPLPAPTPDPSRPQLVEAVADGILELLGAQLDRLGDMATTDFALDPLDLEAPETIEPELRGERLQRTLLPWEPWSSCGLDAVVPVDLRATGGLVPLQVTLASRGSRAVALVTLGRPGGAHRGMIFPESRWVEWDGTRAVVSTTPGFAPDAAVVLRERDAAVFSYTRRGPDGQEMVPSSRDEAPPPPSALGVTRIGPRGRTLGSTVVVPRTEGLLVDAPPVAWEGGTAVVLGHPNPSLHHEDARTEELWFLDNLGRSLRAPLPLTHESREDPGGALCTSLSAALNGASLLASWTVPSGPRAGVWVRRGIHLDAAPDPAWDAPRGPRGRLPRRRSEQIIQGIGWSGPVVSPWGVMVRRSARRLEGDAPMTDVVLAGAPAPRATPRVFDRFWDPLPVWGRGGVVMVGLAADTPSALTRAWLRWAPHAARGTHPVAPLRPERDGSGVSPSDALDDLPEAVDYAIAPLEHGALLAWIVPAEGDPTGPRRLSLARVACRLAPSDRAPSPGRPTVP